MQRIESVGKDASDEDPAKLRPRDPLSITVELLSDLTPQAISTLGA